MKAKLCLVSSCFMIAMLMSFALASTTFETNIKVQDGHSVFRENVNGQNVEIETEGGTEITSSFVNGEYEVEAEGTGEVTAEGKGGYEIDYNGHKEAGTGVFSRFYEYAEDFVFKLTVISGFV